MLRLTLSKDDYIMIGEDIRLQYKHNTGKDSFSIAIQAPRDIKILRKNLYENEIRRSADQGDEEALFLLELFKEESEERRRISAVRRKKQQFHRTTVNTKD